MPCLIVSFIKHIVLKQGIQTGVEFFSLAGHGIAVHLRKLGSRRGLIPAQIGLGGFQKLVIGVYFFVSVVSGLVGLFHLALVGLDLVLQALNLRHLLGHLRVGVCHVYSQKR